MALGLFQIWRLMDGETAAAIEARVIKVQQLSGPGIGIGPQKIHWTTTRDRALLWVSGSRIQAGDFLLTPRAQGHCGVVLVTTDAVQRRGEDHDET